MLCPRCGAENNEKALFCQNCGKGLSAKAIWTSPGNTAEKLAPAVKCPNCGTENPEGKEFCGDCGARIVEPPSDEPSPASNVKRKRIWLRPHRRERIMAPDEEEIQHMAIYHEKEPDYSSYGLMVGVALIVIGFWLIPYLIAAFSRQLTNNERIEWNVFAILLIAVGAVLSAYWIVHLMNQRLKITRFAERARAPAAEHAPTSDRLLALKGKYCSFCGNICAPEATICPKCGRQFQ
jgi:rubrerythrin